MCHSVLLILQQKVILYKNNTCRENKISYHIRILDHQNINKLIEQENL